jgi:hypothetical protein
MDVPGHWKAAIGPNMAQSYLELKNECGTKTIISWDICRKILLSIE